jgi:ribosomal protein L29
MRKKLVGLGVSLYSKGEGNLKEGKMLRRDIAQILTIMQSKKTKIEETDNSSKEAK